MKKISLRLLQASLALLFMVLTGCTTTSIKGYKTLLRQDPIEGARRLDLIIKNTYRTLLTRGMKGCYIYFTDPETREYFKGLSAHR